MTRKKKKLKKYEFSAKIDGIVYARTETAAKILARRKIHKAKKLRLKKFGVQRLG